jgi:LmbE family N-acetylglucosaminyl deacetylase
MNGKIKNMLVISPHPDDSVLGAGGAMARFVKNGGEVAVLTIAVHSPPLFSNETSDISVEEARKAHSIIGVKESIFLNMPALSLEKLPQHELARHISDVIDKVKPIIIMIPFPDRNSDHRAVFEAAMVASRPVSGRKIPIIASYEILSSTYFNAPYIEPNFIPNWTIDIGDFIAAKIEALKCYSSHIGPIPHPRSCEALRALALFKGSQRGMEYGEDFYIIRMTVPPESL